MLAQPLLILSVVLLLNNLIASSSIARINPTKQNIYLDSIQAQTIEEVSAQQAIVNQLRFENPEYGHLAEVRDIVLIDDYGMADWFIGEGGGYATLVKRNGAWQAVIHGDDWGEIDEIIADGIPRNVAERLLDITFSDWRIAEESLTQQESYRLAEIFDPPSNVRLTPGGDILCSVGERATIVIYRQLGDWYATDICGRDGFIHSSQIRFL
jgi:hypothetical protein